MKRTTLWKLVSVCLLIAVSLPIFSALAPTPVDGLDASSLVAPLPFAMEQYGQHHTDIFKDAAPALDGNADDVYTLLDTYNEGAGHYNGVFSSLNENGSHLNDANEEFIPDLLEIRGSYDDNYVYFYIKTITRNTATGYSITPKFGFNFSDSQSDAHDGTTLPAFTITDTEGVKSGEDFYISTEKSAEMVGDSTGEYYVNTTVYEFRVAWSSIAGDLIPEKDFARMYFTLNVPFYNGNTGGTAYWIYGVPNEAPLMGDYLLGTAFGDKADSALPYTPNVVNLQGAKIDESEYPAPAITGVIRNDQNNEKNRSFKVTYTTTKLVEGEAETGILYLADASKIAANHLTANTEGVENLEGELMGYDPDNSIFTYQANFKTTEENYSKFFALRPYVKYADGTVVYGPYYNNTPEYFDEANKSEYDEYYKVLCISCSFSGGEFDELLSLAKAERIHLTLARTYSSGQKAYEHWNWLLKGDDYLVSGKDKNSSGIKFGVWSTSKNTIESYGYGYTMEEGIHFYDDWDIISVQDHYSAALASVESPEQCYVNCMNSSMPHLPGLFQYLSIHFPNADLYLRQTWAYQVGKGYSVKDGFTVNTNDKEHIIEDTENGGIMVDLSKMNRTSTDYMFNTTQQKLHQDSITDACYKMSELMGVALVPSGDAWEIAREMAEVGDTLCDQYSGTKIIPDDYFHDGPAGGEFLNACVWFEMITGRDVTKTTWKPSNMTAARADALRAAAHEAVQIYKTTDSWLNNTSVEK